MAQVSIRTFIHVIAVQHESPSVVLARCDVSVEYFTLLITQPPPRAPVHPPHELLALLTQFSRDPRLAPDVCSPALLSSLRSPLLCGLPSLQLAVVELLRALEEAGCGSMLCSENTDGFLLELSRNNLSSRKLTDGLNQQMVSDKEAETTRINLGLALQALVLKLLSIPRSEATQLCLRVLDVAITPFESRSHSAKQLCVAVEQSVEWLTALLGWYSPTSSRESSRLAKFCVSAVPHYLQRRRRIESGLMDSNKSMFHSQQASEAVANVKENHSLAVSIQLVRMAAASSKMHKSALEDVLAVCDDVLFPRAFNPRVLIELGLDTIDELAQLLTTILEGDLSHELLSRFVNKVELHCILLITFAQRIGVAEANNCSCPTTRLAITLLCIRGSLPKEWRPHHSFSLKIEDCIGALEDGYLHSDAWQLDLMGRVEWILLLLGYYLAGCFEPCIEDECGGVDMAEAQARATA